jgi:hypothetical protein
MKKRESSELSQLQTAVRKLYEINNRMQALIIKKRYGSSKSPRDERQGEENIEDRVQRFSEALIEYLKLRRRLRESLAAFQDTLRNLQNAEDVKEISTLMGLSVLASHAEYHRVRRTLMERYENTIFPGLPEVEREVKLAAEMNEFGKWMARITDFNLGSGEDDFTRMIIAIRDRNVDKFNEIYERVLKRIETEEGK